MNSRVSVAAFRVVAALWKGALFLGTAMLMLEACGAAPCLQPPAGLVSWWPAEGSGEDIAGTNRATLINGVGYVDGKVGLGFAFDGVNDYVLVPDSASLDLTNELTIELWFKPDPAASIPLFDKRDGAVSCNYGAILAPAHGVQLYYNDPTLNDGDYPGSGFEISAHFPLPSDGVFHHFAGTYRQTDATHVELRTYVDGALVRTRTILGNLARTVNSAPVSIGAEGAGSGAVFKGIIDEVAIYSRALSADEILAIHAADGSGKCFTNLPPVILSPPTSQPVLVGGTATFTVVAGGSRPLTYQWFFESTEITGATNSTLVLTDIQPGQAGSYSVEISNPSGSVTSEAAFLTVTTSPGCAPAGLVSWWTGDGNATDLVGLNNANVPNGVSYAPGMVGLGFALDGVNDYVLVPDSTSLDLTNEVTVELWFKADSATSIPLFDKRDGGAGCNYGVILSPAYGVQLYYNDPAVNDGDYPGSGFEISAHFPLPSTGAFHHFAGSYRQADATHVELKTYLDGALVRTRTFLGNLGRAINNAPFSIGSEGAGSGAVFKGIIDEVSLYSRALTADEILAIYSAGSTGKCRTNLPPIAPFITGNPTGLSVYVGDNATFSVTAGGSTPLGYQWLFNGNPLAGAVGSSLVLSNVSLQAAGAYSVIVSNLAGTATSGGAMLTVTPPPPANLLRGPYLQLATPTSITVRWRTDVARVGKVKFGNSTSNLVSEAGGGTGTTEHSVTLEGLIPDTRYFYAVEAGDDRLAGGADYHFVTPPMGKKPTRIWAIGDCGTASIGSSAPLAVRNAYSSFAGARPTDVWLMLGDNAYYSGTDGEYQAAVFNVYQQTLRTTPVWSTLGNHETYASASGGPLPYFDIFTLPNDGRAGGVASGTERYYSFNYGNIHFVCLDSETSDRSPSGPMVTWLQEDLAADTNDWLIAYWHSPPYSKGSHNSDLELNLIEMRESVVPVLEAHGVDLVLCGHSHSYERSHLLEGHHGSSPSLTPAMILDSGGGRPEESGAYLKRPDEAHQGAVYVVAGSAGQVSGGPLNHPAMFVSLNRLGSMVIDVDGEQLHAKFLRENGTVDDHFSIVKGTPPPSIIAQPTNQTRFVGGTATMSVIASGAPPLSYQWLFNGSPIPQGTNAALSLNNIQFGEAGAYSVEITNSFGSVTSAVAVLTVIALPVCSPAPADLVSFWPADGSTEDLVGTNHATLRNGANFTTGMVGQGFSFDGVNDFVLVADSSSLDLTNELTMELWFKAEASASIALFDKRAGVAGCNYGSILAPAYGVQLYYNDPTVNDGDFPASGFEISAYQPLPSTGVFHHFAGTYRQADSNHVELKTYIDGALVRTRAILGNLARTVNNAPLSIGSEGGGTGAVFKGVIDEVSLYKRALTAAEIQSIFDAGVSGKCVHNLPPVILAGPTNRTVEVGTSVTLQVVAGGGRPLDYQWWFEGAPLAGATSALLSLDNIEFGQAGNYSVIVSNLSGSVTSSVAVLSVRPPPSQLRLGNVSGPSGGMIEVPVHLVSQGVENALGFSVQFNPSLLSYEGITPGLSLPLGSATFVNTNSATSGRIGLAIALPANEAIPAGSSQVLRIGFRAAVVSAPVITPVALMDQPTPRQISDTLAQPLLVVSSNGIVELLQARYEADVAPRPGGDFIVGIVDWVQTGRFVAGLDSLVVGEFQTVDCAPRESSGNGAISVTDWVQAGRFAAGIDPLIPVGGPTGPVAPPGGGFALQSAGGRLLSIPATNVLPGGSVTVPVKLAAQGDENAVGFSVAFDPARLAFTSAVRGIGAFNATLNVNANSAADGRIGIALALPAGTAVLPGPADIVLLGFEAAPGATGAVAVTFGNQPVLSEVSDASARALACTYAGASLVIGSAPPSGPTLSVARTASAVILFWPASAQGYDLYFSTNLAGQAWTKAPGSPIEIGGQMILSVSITGSQQYFRLMKP